jgi:hypothetical protein
MVGMSMDVDLDLYSFSIASHEQQDQLSDYLHKIAVLNVANQQLTLVFSFVEKDKSALFQRYRFRQDPVSHTHATG